MAIKQYIGARYVPKFEGVFDSTRSYEPLSVVDDANGNSYTSKIPVPAGSSLDDRTYWAPTGNYSGALRQLESRMDTAEGNIVDLDGRVTTAEGNIVDLGDGVSSLDTRVTALESGADDRNIYLIVTDSYGGRHSDGLNFGEIINNRSEKTVDIVSLGSAGFGSVVKLLTALESWSGDKTKVKKIIIVAGANDIASTEENILSGMSQFRSYLNTNYSGVPVSVFACGISTSYETNKYINMLTSYKKGCGINDFSYVNNSEFVLHDSRLISDTTHPNADGVEAIANAVEMSMNSDNCEVLNELKLTGGLTQLGDNVDSSTSYLIECLNNNTVILSSFGTQFLFDVQFTNPEAVNTSYYTTWKRVGAFSAFLWSNQSNDNDRTVVVPAVVYYSDNTIGTGTVIFNIDRGYLYSRCKVGALKTVTKYEAYGTVTLQPLFS